MCAVWRTYRENAIVLLVRFESPPTQHDAGDLRPSYASNRVLAATIWFHGTQTVQTANANTGVGSGRRPLYGSDSGHFMVQVTPMNESFPVISLDGSSIAYTLGAARSLF